jgi:hypothetical protein
LPCACGAAVKCPAEPPEDPTAYALAPEAAVPERPRRSIGGTTTSGAAATAARGAPIPLTYRAQKEAGPADPETIKNLYMPLWLLGGGVVISVVAALINQRESLSKALLGVGIQMAVGTTLMIVGLLLAAKPRGLTLGPLRVALFKLAAISVAPGSLLELFEPMLDHLPFGGLAGWLGSFVLYFALLGVLFDLDESDTWYCVFVIFLVQVAVYFLLLWFIR